MYITWTFDGSFCQNPTYLFNKPKTVKIELRKKVEQVKSFKCLKDSSIGIIYWLDSFSSFWTTEASKALLTCDQETLSIPRTCDARYNCTHYYKMEYNEFGPEPIFLKKGKWYRFFGKDCIIECRILIIPISQLR